jgi:hypothetical protein
MKKPVSKFAFQMRPAALHRGVRRDGRRGAGARGGRASDDHGGGCSVLHAALTLLHTLFIPFKFNPVYP